MKWGDAVSLPDGTDGAPYSETLAAANGTTPYVWSLQPGSGSLPNGLSIDPNGALTGTPTQGGTFDFTVQATDANGMVATADLSLTVDPASTTTAVSLQPPQPSLAQSTTATATIASGGVPVTSGSIQWVIDGADSGSPVAVDGSGSATVAAPPHGRVPHDRGGLPRLDGRRPPPRTPQASRSRRSRHRGPWRRRRRARR